METMRKSLKSTTALLVTNSLVYYLVYRGHLRCDTRSPQVLFETKGAEKAESKAFAKVEEDHTS